MPNCSICGRWIDVREEHKKDTKGHAYCRDCKGPRSKPGPPKDARRHGKPSPRKVSFDHGKKPELRRLGAGWRCPDCGKWITGPEHICAGKPSPRQPRLSRTPSSTQYGARPSGYANVPASPRARSSRPSLESKYSESEFWLEPDDDAPVPEPPVRRKPLTAEEKKAGKKILKAVRAHRAERGRGKLKAALETRKAMKGIGYDVDPQGEGLAPIPGDYELKPDEYKHLEPDYVWEAIDPDHRRGHFLNIQYQKWLADHKKLGGMSFWEYIDQNAIRAASSQNPVRYIKKKNLPHYKISPRSSGGRLKLYRGQPGELFDTSDKLIIWNGIQHGWAIYVQDPDTSVIYSASAAVRNERVEMHEMADEKRSDEDMQLSVFHHSSFLGGKPVLCAGEWMVIKGEIICVSPMTGHYKITVPQFMNFLDYLENKLKADLKRITVKWPWPQVDLPDYPYPHYYNAYDFLHVATELEFMCEPYGEDGPLRETDRYNKSRKQDPRSGDIQYAPSRLRPSPPSVTRKECPKCGYPNCACEEVD